MNYNKSILEHSELTKASDVDNLKYSETSHSALYIANLTYYYFYNDIHIAQISKQFSECWNL